MPLVPLSFVVAVLVALLIPRVLAERDGAAAPARFAALLALYAVLATLVGLRWGYGLVAVLPLQSIGAACWAPLAWLAFRSLAHEREPVSLGRDWPHLAVPVTVVAAVALWPDPIDLVLVGAYLGYGAALAALWRRGPDALSAVRLGDLAAVHRALGVTAAALVAFAFIDLLVSLDFRLGDGSRAPLIVTLATVPVLLAVGWAAGVAGIGGPPDAPADAPADADADAARGADPMARPRPAVEGPERGADDALEDTDEASRETLASVHRALTRDGLYRDPDLTLERIARRSAIPARRVSAAINRVTGDSVSRYLSALRIEDVKRRLADTDASVTEAMLASGFRTKSNFNRVFRDAEGASPSEWRTAHRAGGAAAGPR